MNNTITNKTMFEFQYIYFSIPRSARTMPYLKVNGIHKESEKAVCLNIGFDETENIWFPKSVINKAKKDDLGNPTLPHWFKFSGRSYNQFAKVVSTLPC